MNFKDFKKLFVRKVNPKKEVVEVNRDLHEEITVEFSDSVVTGPPHLIAEYIEEMLKVQARNM